AKVVGLTISREQRDFAQKRIHDAGLNDKVEIRLQDYRDERERYDRIASIEMIEAVGEQFWPKYFSQLRDRLLPGGLARIQAITIRDSSFKSYRREVDFIQRYVFPGGMLPPPQALKSLGERFGVPVIRERIFEQDYAKTLATWRNNCRSAWRNLTPLRFDASARRAWVARSPRQEEPPRCASNRVLCLWCSSSMRLRRRKAISVTIMTSGTAAFTKCSCAPIPRPRAATSRTVAPPQESEWTTTTRSRSTARGYPFRPAKF